MVTRVITHVVLVMVSLYVQHFSNVVWPHPFPIDRLELLS